MIEVLWGLDSLAVGYCVFPILYYRVSRCCNTIGTNGLGRGTKKLGCQVTYPDAKVINPTLHFLHSFGNCLVSFWWSFFFYHLRGFNIVFQPYWLSWFFLVL